MVCDLYSPGTQHRLNMPDLRTSVVDPSSNFRRNRGYAAKHRGLLEQMSQSAPVRG